MAKPIHPDAPLRPLLVAALIRNGGHLRFSHQEFGEAAVAAFDSDIVIELDHDGATFSLQPAGAATPKGTARA